MFCYFQPRLFAVYETKWLLTRGAPHINHNLDPRHLLIWFSWPVFIDSSPHFKSFVSCVPPAKASSADGSQSHASAPHLVQPHPAHAHLLRLLSFWTNSTQLPQLPNTDAGEDKNTFETHLCKRTIECEHHRLHVSQHNGSYQPSATSQPVPEAGAASNPCLPEENQNQQPPQAATQPQPQGATQDAVGYMLTPNAPALYGPSYSPFEKPPPYACWAPRLQQPAPPPHVAPEVW